MSAKISNLSEIYPLANIVYRTLLFQNRIVQKFSVKMEINGFKTRPNKFIMLF